MSCLTISINRFKKIVKTIFTKAGVTDEEAEVLTDALLTANLSGVDSHGFGIIPGYLRHIKAGEWKSGQHAEIVHETSVIARIDGHDGIGELIAKEAMEVAIRKAKENQVSTVSVFNCNHVGRLGYYTLMAAQQDMIGMMMCSTGPGVAPHGGVERILGTNPISIAIPGKEFIFFLDIATSYRAAGWAREAMFKGEKIPVGWMISDKGQPVTDPSVKFLQPPDKSAALTFGGYKGYGLSLAIDILSGCLSGDGSTIFMHRSGRHEHNPLFISVINIAAFTPVNDFKERVEYLFKAVKNSKKAPGVEEILIPGELELRAWKKRSREGIPIHEKIWEEVALEARKLGIDLEKIK